MAAVTTYDMPSDFGECPYPNIYKIRRWISPHGNVPMCTVWFVGGVEETMMLATLKEELPLLALPPHWTTATRH